MESRVVVAIDFGTTFSGFAYALRSDEKTYSNYHWPGSTTAPYAKNKTALKYDVEAKFGHEERVHESQAPAQWGWQAFEASKESGNNKGYCQRFKLHIAPKCDPDQLEPLETGVTPEKAISDYLRLIGKMAEHKVKEKTGYDKSDIQWCLTVPAIWDENAKSIMKKAGKKAGLWRDPEVPGEGSRFPPIVVLEPEAAALYCSSYSDEHRDFTIEKNDDVLIVDAGGGTVDLVAHRVVSEDAKTFREITQGSGEMCGGTTVDARFLKHLQDTIHGAKDFLRDHPQMLGRIMITWEANKKNFDGTKEVLLDLPTQVERLWERELRKQGEDKQADELDGFRLSVDIMKFIFDPVVEQILSLIQDQLNEIKRKTKTQAKVMYLVGGFSESVYLQRRVKMRFNKAVKHIYHPPNPGSAIVLGAVKYGLDTDRIVARIMRRTYGVKTHVPFNERDHDPSRKVWCKKRERWQCKDVFLPYVSAGDEVPAERTVRKKLRKSSLAQTVMNLHVLSSEDVRPMYVDDPNVREEAIIQIPVDDKMDTSYECEFSFGSTTLEVAATEVETGVKKVVQVDFDRSQEVGGV